MRVAYHELRAALVRILIRAGFETDRAELCARLFADASRDGVASHGLNRFPRFLDMIHAGVVDVRARPERLAAHRALERWHGHRGPGNLNAHHAMQRAIVLARDYGIGCVALAFTNHWMRGGAYGWQAAEAGTIGICWTNTLPNLPPWGSTEPQLGNNPLVLAIPRGGGRHIVLDMAMSQFSFGALESYRRRGDLLPVPGGFDPTGELTCDPVAIEASGRPLPIGYWKGAGLALVLDVVASLLSGGRATHEIPPDSMRETDLSQVFIAIDPAGVGAASHVTEVVDRIVEALNAAAAVPGERVTYPGQRTLETRERSLAEGVPVDEQIWEMVHGLAG